MSAAPISRTVVKSVHAIEQSEGVGARVRRSIGSGALRNLTPFLMLDHMKASGSGSFPDHPHRGQATISYILEGSSSHEDSEGHKGMIVAGGVQWMTAGRGVIHSEMPVYGKGQPSLHGFQLWVDLPKQHKMTKPSYHELGPEAIPSVYPNGPDGDVRIKIIGGQSHGVSSPVPELGGCWYFHIFLKRSGSTVSQDIPHGWTAFLYPFKGSIVVGSPGSGAKSYSPFHCLVLSSSADETCVQITASEDDTELILCAGKPLDQPIFQYGPFVMTSQKEIQDTLMDYQLARNGFEKAHIWKSRNARSMH